ncbi:MAG: hypothetical protein EXX96DRAFT_481064 [Benjaminiella poitrasii]|nr:MAG: hypothetical protein EXX96DRAFT_481064 [Benjaminiella poitrasii]
MSIKFKGFSTITLSAPYNLETTCPFLPKLKLTLLAKTTLGVGDHTIPWELDIPNLYPRSLLIKRASIHYKLIVSVSLAGFTTRRKPVTAERPVVISRHLLPYKELAPAIETRIYALIFNLDSNILHSTDYKDSHVKYIKRTAPALIHLVPESSESAWKRPYVIQHTLHPSISHTLISPLVSIYHQIEVTFQFGHKYEEIKSKIPIIIASVPQGANTNTTGTAKIKYAFEQNAVRSDYLKHVMEKGSSSSKKYQMDDSDYSLPFPETTAEHAIISDNDDEDEIPQPRLSDQRRLFCSSTSGQRHQQQYQDDNGLAKKFASAIDLSIPSISSSQKIECCGDEEDDYYWIPEERPRTTTPTMRRRNRKILQPIDVDLANSTRKDRVVPRVDHTNVINQSHDDLSSVYSETSILSNHNGLLPLKLHSRPPSPEFTLPLGLPSTIALHPHPQQQQGIEEFFPANTTTPSPHTTVASSTLLSPQTSDALRTRMIALSTISSLTSDSVGRCRASSTAVDPDMAALMLQQTAAVPPYQYIHAKLPPIPTAVDAATKASRRLTKVYLDDSDDDDDDDEEGSIHKPSFDASRLDEAPKLPRLSFGKNFSISLGIQ